MTLALIGAFVQAPTHIKLWICVYFTKKSYFAINVGKGKCFIKKKSTFHMIMPKTIG